MNVLQSTHVFVLFLGKKGGGLILLRFTLVQTQRNSTGFDSSRFMLVCL